MSGAFLVWVSSLVGAASAFLLGFVVAAARAGARRPAEVEPPPGDGRDELPTPVPTGEEDGNAEARRNQRALAAELDEQIDRAEQAEAELRRLQGIHRPSMSPDGVDAALREELELERRRREAAVQSQLSVEQELQNAWREIDRLRNDVEGGGAALVDDLGETTVVTETKTLQSELDKARAEADELREEAGRAVAADREAASMRGERDDLTKRLEVLRTELERVRQQLAAARQRSSDLNAQLREMRSGSKGGPMSADGQTAHLEKALAAALADAAKAKLAAGEAKRELDRCRGELASVLDSSGDGVADVDIDILRSSQSRRDFDMETPRPREPDSAKPTPPAHLVSADESLGGALAGLEGSPGCEMVLLTDQRGTVLEAHGDGERREELAALSGIAGGLGEDAHETLSLAPVESVVLRDAEDVVLSWRFFSSGGEAYVLASLGAGEPPSEVVEDRAVEALSRLLEG